MISAKQGQWIIEPMEEGATHRFAYRVEVDAEFKDGTLVFDSWEEIFENVRNAHGDDAANSCAGRLLVQALNLFRTGEASDGMIKALLKYQMIDKRELSPEAIERIRYYHVLSGRFFSFYFHQKEQAERFIQESIGFLEELYRDVVGKGKDSFEGNRADFIFEEKLF